MDCVGNEIRCTALEALTTGEYYDAIGDTMELYCAGGRVPYRYIAPSSTLKNVRVVRYVPGSLKVITRYLHPDTDVVLREI